MVDTATAAESGRVVRPPVLVIDDHEMLATSLVHVLNEQEFDAHRLAVTDVETMTTQAMHHRPGVVLLDLNLGLGVNGQPLDGGELVWPLVRQGWRVLVLTGLPDVNRIAAAVAAGATSWILKSASFEELTSSVAEAARGGTIPHQRRARPEHRRDSGTAPLEARRKLNRLSPREREVLDELGCGHGPADIARRTHTSVGTVRTHVRAILSKLDVGSQIAAVALAYRAQVAAPSIPAGQWRRATRR